MSETDVGLQRTKSSTVDGAADRYDHAITLIDTTVPQEPDKPKRNRSTSPLTTSLTKKSTRTTVKEQLARRKYAKWQQDKFPSREGPRVNEDGKSSSTPKKSRGASPHPPQDLPAEEGVDTGVTEATDFAEEPHADQARGRKDPAIKGHKKRHEQPFEVDILYENQRGWFLFGIPLYSHSSLLNFDPGPWVSKDLKDSAVNITNAQLPDPSWDWAWNSWYVDMSYDVDEEGWQYSFSFNSRFSWHGTHPWFHSYVRRRRWLRKRVKRHEVDSSQKLSGITAGHKLTGDYFTIHPNRDRSPASIDDAPKVARPASYISMRSKTDDDELPEEIKDLPSLHKALRLSAIDREKIDVVQKFLDSGGDELVYLVERMPELMSFLVFQNSRQQLLRILKSTLAAAEKHRDEHDAEPKPEDEADGRRIDNLQKAVEAAEREIRGLEYYSDRGHVLKTTDERRSDGRPKTDRGTSARSALEENPVDTIKGISRDAELDAKPSTSRSLGTANQKRNTLAPEDAKQDGRDKGKGKAKAVEEENLTDDKPSSRLGADQVFIPD